MLTILPCLDSPEMAAARRRELDISRRFAVELGKSAVAATESGTYRADTGKLVDWSQAVRDCLSKKHSFPPDAELPRNDGQIFAETRVRVVNATTLGASHRLVTQGHAPLALNFANGISPGGGFLKGARAQEEVLCRSSALYATLVDDPMYGEHRKRPLPDSTDWVIYSPNVPVFRRDDGSALEEPWQLSFLTCAAPYAPRIGQAAASRLLRRRIHRVLAIAQAYGHSITPDSA